jgi:hypothetical protein
MLRLVTRMGPAGKTLENSQIKLGEPLNKNIFANPKTALKL